MADGLVARRAAISKAQWAKKKQRDQELRLSVQEQIQKQVKLEVERKREMRDMAAAKCVLGRDATQAT